MGSVKVTEGAVVKLRGTGRTGKVIALTTQKTGQRGRPPTLASVVLDDATETTVSVRELSLI